MGTLERKEEGWDQKAQGTGRPATSGRASWALSMLCRHVCRGRFGQVHRCTEKSTGLSLAAKVIKVKSTKDRVRPPKPLAELRTPACLSRPPGAPHCPGPPRLDGRPGHFSRLSLRLPHPSKQVTHTLGRGALLGLRLPTCGGRTWSGWWAETQCEQGTGVRRARVCAHACVLEGAAGASS